MRPEEQFAAACVEAAVPDVVVLHHDNEKRTSAHDFDLMSGSEIVGAMEVTSAPDGEAIAVGRELAKGGPLTVPGLAANWMVRVRPVDPRGVRSRMALLRSQVGGILIEFQMRGIDRFDSDRYIQYAGLADEARRLGIRDIFVLKQQGVGRVYFEPWYPIDQIAGFVRPDGNALADWIGEWLRDPLRADNLSKLRRSGLDERHLFVFLPLPPTAPFEVFNVFLNGVPPTRDPELPGEVTHVWAASDRDRPGWRWCPAEGWTAFIPRAPANSTLPCCACP